MEVSSVSFWDLPNEVLYQILSYLSVKDVLTSAVNVCSRWRSIVEENVLFWQNLQVVIDCDNFLNTSHLNTFSNQELLQSPEQEEELYVGEYDLDRIFKVRNIKLENGGRASSQPGLFLIRILDVLSKTCKDIEKVECFQCVGALSSDFLKFLNHRYKRIIEIKYGISCVWRIPYEELSNFKNLTTFVAHDYKFKKTDMYCLVDGCGQLNSLWLLFSRSLRNEDVLYLLEKKKTTLRELGLGMSVSDEVLAKVKECCQLQVLFFSDARYISDDGICNFVDLTKNLRYMSLHRAKFKPQTMLSWIATLNIASQLIVLDLTEYVYRNSLFRLLSQMNKPCRVTFSNDVLKAGLQSRKPLRTPHLHWMYLNAIKTSF